MSDYVPCLNFQPRGWAAAGPLSRPTGNRSQPCPGCLQQTAANKGLTPGFKDLRLRIFSRRLFCADSYESSRLCRHLYQSWPSLKYLQTMTNMSPHIALIEHTTVLTIPRELPGWLCHTAFGHGHGCLLIKRGFVPKGGMHMLALNPSNAYSSPRTSCKHYPTAWHARGQVASMEIHSAMKTLFGSPKLKRPEKTWVNVHALWSRL